MKPQAKSAAALILFSAALGSSGALACSVLDRGNQKTEKTIQLQQAELNRLQENVASMEAECTSRQTSISKRGAAAASAESCVTFRENAAIHGQLTQVSEACSSHVTLVRERMDDLQAKYILPQESDLSDVVQLEGELKSLQQVCGPALEKTQSLHARSAELLLASKAAIQRAQKAIENYTSLGNQTRTFAASSEASLKACSSGNSLEAPIQFNAVAPGGPLARAFPGGKSLKDASDITGKIEGQSLSESPGQNRQGKASPEQAPADSLFLGQKNYSTAKSPALAAGDSPLASGQLLASSKTGHFAVSRSGSQRVEVGANSLAPEKGIANKNSDPAPDQRSIASIAEEILSERPPELPDAKPAMEENTKASSNGPPVGRDLFERIHGILRKRH